MVTHAHCKLHHYEVIVGNIGTVYRGGNGFEARRQYYAYVGMSRGNAGRVAGENVVLMKDDKLDMEYAGTLEQEA